ncbi:HAD family hydrolase [Arthrobacter agilis]|uniref:HAD family hydrolase n=1 Tax=Arthrobacter agilis TaxID=37921 RepID=UPI00277F432F|nr:HAD family hydrolase [Arthrobacter agilis]MDQ0735688.1 phosphoglycolate phosphatase-like HAD superfamily hydrolase [Arthrobacter agilis]
MAENTTEAAGGRAGVLFDVDGTLVDSNYQHTLAWWQAFRRFGHDVPAAEIHRAIGMGGDKLVAHLLGDDRDPDQDSELDATHGAIFSTFWPGLRAFEGAGDLVRRCADSGLTVVLASSASQQELEVLRRIIDADASITAATSSTDAENSKPSPDILQAALDAGGLDAAHAVFVGDSVWDVIAAAELKITTVGLASGGTSEAELRDAGAVEVYKDIRALLDAFDDGPLHRQAKPSSTAPAS